MEYIHLKDVWDLEETGRCQPLGYLEPTWVSFMSEDRERITIQWSIIIKNYSQQAGPQYSRPGECFNRKLENSPVLCN